MSFLLLLSCQEPRQFQTCRIGRGGPLAGLRVRELVTLHEQSGTTDCKQAEQVQQEPRGPFLPSSKGILSFLYLCLP